MKNCWNYHPYPFLQNLLFLGLLSLTSFNFSEDGNALMIFGALDSLELTDLLDVFKRP
jgi:hypothetical protein